MNITAMGSFRLYSVSAALSLLVVFTVSGCRGPEAADDGWEAELRHRLEIDFCRTRQEVGEYIARYIPDVSDARIDAWTATGGLEAMSFGDSLRYFRNAAPNLFRIDPMCRALKESLHGRAAKSSDDPIVAQVFREASASGEVFVMPRRMKVRYTLTVRADAVPEGETIRCWLPFPRTDVARQSGVRMTGTVPGEYLLSPPDAPHSTAYMEQFAVAGEPTVFEETFEYTAYAECHAMEENAVRPYDRRSRLYREYTSARNPHMVFSELMRSLSDSLTAGIENPYERARAIYDWIDASIPWASAREYSTIENIPEYVLENGHGDCGMQTLTFMTLARIAGIPTRWQSGFYMKPGDDNLHDWCEVYFEGVGWVPVDMSFGTCDAVCDAQDGEALRHFYLGSVEPWRMAVNRDYGRELIPSKIFPRSETVDFQRGEVEWRGGNLYFDQWRWKMEVEYLD